jgi:predicted MPP superfamily phosphohydrolase
MATRRFGRRRFLRGAAAMAAVGAASALPAAALAEPDGAHPEHVDFLVPGLDPAHDGLRIAQLSDLHAGPRTPDATILGAVAAANAFEPDLVLLTGDFVCRSRAEVGKARELLAGLRAPTFAVLGNHDNWTDPVGMSAALREDGYEVLENAWTTLPLRGAPLALVGVGDRLTGREDVARATRGLQVHRTTPIVLAHGPRTADTLRALGRPALCFSGHTHGGQVNLPIVTPLLFAALHEPYVRGAYRVGDVHLYVNRGVGMSGLRVRVNAPPEVTLGTLRAADVA